MQSVAIAHCMQTYENAYDSGYVAMNKPRIKINSLVSLLSPVVQCCVAEIVRLLRILSTRCIDSVIDTEEVHFVTCAFLVFQLIWLLLYHRDNWSHSGLYIVVTLPVIYPILYYFLI
jgi:hypothetical protein